MARRWWFTGGFVALSLVLLPGPGEAASARPPGPARSSQPGGGLGGFSVFGARPLGAGQFSVGAGYIGEEAVCQQKGALFDFHTLFLPLAYGVTDRLTVGDEPPYSRSGAGRR